MNFSDGEKLIISMLCGLYKHFGIDDGVDPDFVEEAIHSGNLWALKWSYPGIFDAEEKHKDVLRETCDVLEMWTHLEMSYDRLTAEEKQQVEREASPFGNEVVFRGFDGNNEGDHLSIAHFLIDRMERFERFAGRNLNSHAPSIDTYRRMLAAFYPIRANVGSGWMKPADIIAVLKEKTHPSYR